MLIREAQRANLDVRVAQSRLTSARAARRLAAYDLVPTITGTGSTSRQQFSVAQTPGLSTQLPASQLWDVGFDASWEVDMFGRVGRTVKAQGALAESSEYGLEDVQVSVAAEVARTYFDLRGAQRQLAVSGAERGESAQDRQAHRGSSGSGSRDGVRYRAREIRAVSDARDNTAARIADRAGQEPTGCVARACSERASSSAARLGSAAASSGHFVCRLSRPTRSSSARRAARGTTTCGAVVVRRGGASGVSAARHAVGACRLRSDGG